ncbi:MAG: hypothetical protein WB586_01375 [Chthoniobacterales bacterium]
MSVAIQEQPIDLLVHLWLKPPAGAPMRTFTFDYDVIAHEIVTHSVFVSVRSDWNNAVFSNQPELVGTIRYRWKSTARLEAGGAVSAACLGSGCSTLQRVPTTCYFWLCCSCRRH